MSMVLGLDSQQHYEVGRLLGHSRDVVRRPPPTARRSLTAAGVVRIMQTGDEYPIYNPRVTRSVAVFELNPDAKTRTITMSGNNLEGKLIVTIDGVSYGQVDCRATTDQLRAAIPLDLDDCRITAFPGYWEFAFEESGRWARTQPVLTVTPYVPSSVPFFDGGLWVQEEAWTSVSDDGDTYATIEITDCLPFIEGEVRRGAIAIAHWSDQAGWIASQWTCRPFTFQPWGT